MKKLSFIALAILVLAMGCKKKEKLGENQFKDARDGQVYSWVKIGNQVWMAQNLNAASEDGSWCYNDMTSNCEKYGRLYSWKAARSACPDGWHLPSDSDWEQLDGALGMNAGKKLKSGSGWKDGGGGSGGSGFNALPGGDRDDSGSFSDQGREAYFWTATSAGGSDAYGRFLSYTSGDISRSVWNKIGGNSVRCIKNN